MMPPLARFAKLGTFIFVWRHGLQIHGLNIFTLICRNHTANATAPCISTTRSMNGEPMISHGHMAN